MVGDHRLLQRFSLQSFLTPRTNGSLSEELVEESCKSTVIHEFALPATNCKCTDHATGKLIGSIDDRPVDNWH